MSTYLMKETEKLMKGSVHKDDFFIICESFLLMTVKETIKRMKEKKYFHCWLLTMNGLKDGTPYDRCPVFNITMFMPLYNSLNRDILQILLSSFHLDPFCDRRGGNQLVGE